MELKPAFDNLIERHGPEIFSYLWRQLYDNADAEDCFQDVFLRAFRAYPRLKRPANYRAWLYKIATNTANTYKLKRKRTAMRTANLDPELLQDGPTTVDIVNRRLIFTSTLEAVERLPEKQRAALLLRKYQGLAYAEIGQALGCSPDSARANVYQALKKLRAELRPLDINLEGDER